MASKSSSHRSGRKRSKLTAGGVWKGENETDPELMEEKDKHPLTYVISMFTYLVCYKLTINV